MRTGLFYSIASASGESKGIGSEVGKTQTMWTDRTGERGRAAPRFPHPSAQRMLEHGSEIKLWTLGRFCRRGFWRWRACVCVCVCVYTLCACMWCSVFHRHTDAPWLIEVLMIFFLRFPSYVCLYVCVSVSLTMYSIFLDCLLAPYWQA